MISSTNAELVVRGGGEEIGLDLWTGCRPQDVAEGVALVDRAVDRARAGRVRTVVASLEASSPASGGVLEVMHRQASGDAGRVTTRRAGSSVLVELRLAA